MRIHYRAGWDQIYKLFLMPVQIGPWGPHCVHDFIESLLVALVAFEPTFWDGMELFARSDMSHMRWASACSGADTPSWVFSPLSDILLAHGLSLTFDHQFSCEWEDLGHH